MRRVVLLLLLLALLPLPTIVAAAPAQQAPRCRLYSETGGYNVCDDAGGRFLTAFETWGLQRIGYPISRRYTRDGFVHQAYQKAIMQARPGGSVVLVNIFDDLHHDGFDDTLIEKRQTPKPLPAGWDGDASFDQIVAKRQQLLTTRPALRAAYFAVGDPLTFFGLPTSEVQDMGNHYAIRLQRAVLQEWKEAVPWARAGEVTIANGGDIAKELGGLPADALPAEGGVARAPQPPAPEPPAARPAPVEPTPEPVPARPAPIPGVGRPQPEWDGRLSEELFMAWEPAAVASGQPYWRLVSAKLCNDKECGGQTNIFFKTLDEGGSPIAGQPVRMFWPSGSLVVPTKGGDWSDFPLYGHDGWFPDTCRCRGGYNVNVEGLPSDTVFGMGLPANLHYSYFLVFQRSVAP